jgi:thioredoxin-like negative regulator of GroEL
MENNLEYIDAYFQGMLEPEEIKRFEQKIAKYPAFADEVALFLSAKQSLREEAAREKKERFRQLLAEQPSVINIDRDKNVRKILIYRITAAAAVIVCMLSVWYFFFVSSASPQQMAQKYIDEKFKTLPVKMSTEKDSIQEGLRLYNEGQYGASLKQFEAILQRDTGNYSIQNFLGIIYLRLDNYDKALQYFKQFENDTLYSNPSQFNQAITLLKRNLPGDKQKARELLQQVRDNDLYGKEFAEKWLDKW